MKKALYALLAVFILALPASEGFAQCVPAAVPYHENFGSGTLDASWQTASAYGPLTQRWRIRAPGRIQVTDQHNPSTPAVRPFHLAMDNPFVFPSPFVHHGGAVYNDALLCADMRGTSGTYLYAQGVIYSAHDARSPLSLYLSDDGGASFVRIKRDYGYTCPSGFFCPAVRVRIRESLDGAARAKGLSLNNKWVIGFEHVADDRLPNDGVTIDSVAISADPGEPFEPIVLDDPREDIDRSIIDCPPWHPACQPVPCDGLDCPYLLDFETRFIDPRVTLLSVNGGTAALGKDDRGYHLRLQALEGVGSHTINVASFTFDFSKLAGEAPAVTFAWQALDQASNEYDGVYLSDDGGASYVKVYDLDRRDATVGEWMTAQLDLQALADRHDLAFTDAFVIAFAHYALDGKGRAGFALDDVRVGRPDDRMGKTTAAASAPVTETGAQPREFTLGANYPNPFNPTTTFSFTLPEAAAVTLVVYDLFGREVARLIDGKEVAAGTHAVAFDAGQLASGTYLYRLTAGDFTATRRMVLVK